MIFKWYLEENEQKKNNVRFNVFWWGGGGTFQTFVGIDVIEKLDFVPYSHISNSFYS